MSDAQKLSRARWAIRDILQCLQSDWRLERRRVEKAVQCLKEASFAESAALLESEFGPVWRGRKRTPQLLSFVQSLFDSIDASVSQRMKHEICSEAGKNTTPDKPTGNGGSTTQATQDDEAADANDQPPAADPAISRPAAVVKSKRSTAKGDAKEKIEGALRKHHNYDGDSCLNCEPIGVNELARKAEVSAGSVTAFFNREFNVDRDGHKKYQQCCRDTGQLIAFLKLLSRDYAAGAMVANADQFADAD